MITAFALAVTSWTLGSFTADPAASPVPAVIVPAAPQVKILPPTLYRLADATGKVWEHENQSWLRRYVAVVNQAVVAPPAKYYMPMYTAPPTTYHIAPMPRSGLFGGRLFGGGGGGCVTMPDGSTVCGR